MSGSGLITRRGFAGGALLAALGGRALAQGFAGLGESADGFAAVTPGRTFSFPGDHGQHPEFRIEWWYVTANLADANGTTYGAQWTLFRQATRPGAQAEGWASQQVWMGHAAVTRGPGLDAWRNKVHCAPKAVPVESLRLAVTYHHSTR